VNGTLFQQILVEAGEQIDHRLKGSRTSRLNHMRRRCVHKACSASVEKHPIQGIRIRGAVDPFQQILPILYSLGGLLH